METIYDHNLSEEEIYALGHQYRSQEWYLNHCDEETAWTDLALLFRHRHDADNEARAWSHIPEVRDEFLRGFDYIELQH